MSNREWRRPQRSSGAPQGTVSNPDRGAKAASILGPEARGEASIQSTDRRRHRRRVETEGRAQESRHEMHREAGAAPTDPEEARRRLRSGTWDCPKRTPKQRRGMFGRRISGFDPKVRRPTLGLIRKVRPDQNSSSNPGTIQGSEACGSNLNVRMLECKLEAEGEPGQRGTRWLTLFHARQIREYTWQGCSPSPQRNS